VGKTQTALSFADGRREHYAYIFFVLATSPAVIVAEDRKVVRRLRLQRPDQDPAEEPEIVDLVKTWLSEHSRWLIMFDNEFEPGIFRRYTPVEGSGYMLSTTRSQVAAEALAERADVYEVRKSNLTKRSSSP